MTRRLFYPASSGGCRASEQGRPIIGDPRWGGRTLGVVVDRWGQDEWAAATNPPNTLRARLMAAIALAAIGLLAVLGAVYEYRMWQDSKVWMETPHDYSPTAYVIAMLAFGTVGLVALGTSWLVWSRRHRRQP